MYLWTVRGTEDHERAVESFLELYGYYLVDDTLIVLLNVPNVTEDAWQWNVKRARYVGERC